MITFDDQSIIISTIIGYIIAIFGVISTIFFGRKTSKLEKEKITLEWQDLETAAKDLAINIQKKFTPDIIFIPDSKDGTIVHMIKTQLSTELKTIPIMVGILIWKNEEGEKPNLTDYLQPFYDVCESKKWCAYIPKEITMYKDKKILIVDDIVFTGDLCSKLKDWFHENKFVANNVKFACIVSTRIANESANLPDYYWKEIDSFDFYFPWGKGR